MTFFMACLRCPYIQHGPSRIRWTLHKVAHLFIREEL